MSGHISVRDPEHPHTFWTNPLGKHFGLLKAEDMVLVDYSGAVIGGNQSRPANAAGFLIHSAIHKARPDVNAACHCHGVAGKAWSAFAKPLEMINQDVCYLYGEAQAVYEDFGGVVFTEEEGVRLAAALGPKGKGMVLRNHGLLVRHVLFFLFCLNILSTLALFFFLVLSQIEKKKKKGILTWRVVFQLTLYNGVDCRRNCR